MRSSFLVPDHEHWTPAAGIGASTLTVPGLFSPIGDPCTYPPAKSSRHRVVSVLYTESRGYQYVGSYFLSGNGLMVEVVMVNE